VVSQGQTQVSIADIRAGAGTSPAGPSATAVAPPPAAHLDTDTVLRALAKVMDPELPMVSIVDLGMIGSVEIEDAIGVGFSDRIRVELLPTFIGCPALDVIRDAVGASLASFGRPVAVEVTFSPPWTTDRVTAAGRRALTAAGIAEPTAPEDVRCPHCRSARVVMDSAFGPTQCRSLYYCRDCRQPFEAMKLV
jgi:ring-1,2-phenylacetyl-CoA epoxidase subunit PaaD